MITITLDNKWKNKPEKKPFSYQYQPHTQGYYPNNSSYTSTYDSKGQPAGAMQIFQRVLQMNAKIRENLQLVAYGDTDFVMNPTHAGAEVEEICSQVEYMKFNMPLDQEKDATPFCVLVKYIDGPLKGKLERATPTYYQLSQTVC